MGKLRWRSAAIALLLPANAWAQKLPDCAEETAHVDELSIQGAVNDFDGVRQEVAAAAYTRSRCMGDNVNRFHLEMFGAYVHEPAGDAAAAILGLGFELHPLGSAPNLTITPLARVGYEHFSGRGDRLVLGGALRVETVLWEKLESRGSGKDAYQIPRTQVLLGGTIEYTDRRSAGGTATGSYLVTSDSRATFGASLGLDQAIGRRNLRFKSTAGYQVLGRGQVNGFGYLDLGLRPVNDQHSDYPWNLTLRASLGDGGYKGLLLGFSKRFTGPRKPKGVH